MSDCESGKLPKPVFYGFLEKQIRMNIAIAFAIAFVGVTAAYYGIVVKKKEAYKEFHK